MNSQAILSSPLLGESTTGKAERSATGSPSSSAEKTDNSLFSNEFNSALENEGEMSAAAAAVAGEDAGADSGAELVIPADGQSLAADGSELPLLTAAEQQQAATAVPGDESLAVMAADTTLPAQAAVGALNPLTPVALNAAVVAEMAARQPQATGPVVVNGGNNGQPAAQNPVANIAVSGDVVVAADAVESVIDKSAKQDQLLAELGRNLRQSLGAARSGDAPATPTPGQFSLDSGLSSFQIASAAARDSASASANTALPRFMSTMETPFNDPRWQGDFSNRVALFAKSGLQQAEIKLNPAHLGPIDIRISMNDEQQASITFVAKNAAVRDAIEAGMPRLREMLNGQGMELADSGISEHAFNDQRDQAARQEGFSGHPSDSDLAPTEEDSEGTGFVSGLRPDAEGVMQPDEVRAVDYYA